MKNKKKQKVESLLISTVLVLILLPNGYSDLATDKQVLVSFRASVGGRPVLKWNVSESTPCSWVGVTCDKNRVYELHLPAMGLSGNLPLGLGNLTHLQTLSLRFNSLSGPIPSDFANLRELRNLYLQGNSFSRKIPDLLFTMQNLVRLNLANNNFSGEFSSGFNNLTRLVTLYLENNDLTGFIPELDIPSLVQFNVSHNQLNGSIPSKLSTMPVSAFDGNSLCGMPLRSCNGTDTGRKKKLSGGSIAGIVIGCLIGFLLVVAILIFLCVRRNKNSKSRSKNISPEGKSRAGNEVSGQEKAVASSESISTEHSGGIKGKTRSGGKKSLVFIGNVDKVFDLEDLLRASAEVLGKGSIGTAYKATLETGACVAVKRLKDVNVSENEFRDKMEEVGRINHENLVPLRAYYYSTAEKLLVYDYMPMGSLSALLHGREAGRSPINWETRLNIALGAARGIGYLHSHSPAISHGNIKSSNILLNKSYEPRVSDFGLLHLLTPSSTPNRITGYRAPEVTDSRKVSQKADVYSFGILLLELLTGKPPNYSLLNEEGVDLPRWVQSVVQEEWTSEVFDVELLRYQNVEDEMVQLLQLALQCTVPFPDNRPSMIEVTKRIEEVFHSSLQREQEITINGVDNDVSAA